MKRQYIVCMRNTHIRLIGPFDNADALKNWACAPGEYGGELTSPATNNPSDDPRWQTIELDDFDEGWNRASFQFNIKVFEPKDGPMPD